MATIPQGCSQAAVPSAVPTLLWRVPHLCAPKPPSLWLLCASVQDPLPMCPLTFSKVHWSRSTTCSFSTEYLRARSRSHRFQSWLDLPVSCPGQLLTFSLQPPATQMLPVVADTAAKLFFFICQCTPGFIIETLSSLCLKRGRADAMFRVPKQLMLCDLFSLIFPVTTEQSHVWKYHVLLIWWELFSATLSSCSVMTREHIPLGQKKGM